MNRIQKIGIGILVAIVVVIAFGFWADKKAQTFFYPVAPPMPPVVDDSMPDILAHLESVLRTNAPQVLAELQPGISSNQISKLEQQYHIQIPDDIEAIYEWHDGAAPMTATNRLDFIPIHHFVPLEDMLSEKADEANGIGTATAAQRAAYRFFAGQRDHWYCLFDDGSGNGYFFDPTRKPTEGAIFCVFVEDNDFTFFPSAKNLMAGIAECYEQGAYRVKTGATPPELNKDFDQSTKIWAEFGANNHPGE